MIRVHTIDNDLGNWPTFINIDSAMNYININSGVFNNGDILAITDYENLTTKFIIARFEMSFQYI